MSDDAGRVFEVESASSVVKVVVRRSGRLRRLGHDHIIASHDLGGFVRIDGSTATADLFVPLAAMTVDEADLRAAAGFTTEPSDEDREGTRRNMLKSLAAATHPFAQVSIIDLPIPTDEHATVDVMLHGVRRSLSVALTVQIGEKEIRARGSFDMLQSDFGIEPFSVLGGALRVEDRVEIEFDLLATRQEQLTMSSAAAAH